MSMARLRNWYIIERSLRIPVQDYSGCFLANCLLARLWASDVFDGYSERKDGH